MSESSHRPFIAALGAAAILPLLHAADADGPPVAPAQSCLPDTGQGIRHAQTFGEDPDYSGSGPSYSDNGDGTVTDQVTGLMWQKADGGEMTWEQAREYAGKLRLGGHQDWRLPAKQFLLLAVRGGVAAPGSRVKPVPASGPPGRSPDRRGPGGGRTGSGRKMRPSGRGNPLNEATTTSPAAIGARAAARLGRAFTGLAAAMLPSALPAAAPELTNVAPADAGGYEVVVTNAGGSTTSEPGMLTVGLAVPAMSSSGCRPAALFVADPAKPEFHNPIEITIGGLQPNTRYYYRLRHRDPGAGEFAARGERSFRTARPQGAPFVFTVTANPHLDVVTDLGLLKRTLANVDADHPDFHLDLGDILMTDKMADGVGGVPPEFCGRLAPDQSRVNDRALLLRGLFEPVCHSIPFFFTLGNHEAEYGYLFNAAADKANNIPAWNLKARKAYYPTPVPGSFYTGNATPADYPDGSLGVLENHYAWEWGDALLVVLDPFWNTAANPGQANDAWKWSLGKPQYDWLERVLRDSSARY